MPIKWKKTEVEMPQGKFTVTHWAKHDPRELLRTIQTPSKLEIKAKPVLLVHDFGKLRIATRLMEPTNLPLDITQHRDPHYLFDRLKQMADQRLSIIETPVAFIENQQGMVGLTTIWKKRTISLPAFFKSRKVNAQQKVEVSKKAMRLLAKLHANGFAHGHPHPYNFVINKRRGNVQFIDYVLTQDLPEPYGGPNKTAHHLAAAILFPRGRPKVRGKYDDRKDQMHRKLTNDFMSEYEQALDRLKAKIEKRARSGK